MKKYWFLAVVAPVAMAAYIGPGQIQVVQVEPKIPAAAEFFGDTPYEVDELAGTATADVDGTLRITDGMLVFDIGAEGEGEGFAIPVAFGEGMSLVECGRQIYLHEDSSEPALMTFDTQPMCSLSVDELNDDLSRLVDENTIAHAVDISNTNMLLEYTMATGYLTVYVVSVNTDTEFLITLKPTTRILLAQELPRCECYYKGSPPCGASITCQGGENPYCSCKKSGCFAKCMRIRPVTMEPVDGDGMDALPQVDPTMQPI